MLKTYDPSKVIINYGGVPIQGYADGSFISISANAQAFTKVVGADGEVTRSKSSDYTSEVGITLQQSSLSNDYLSTIHNLDKTSNAGALPLEILDLSGTTLFFWPEAWVRQLPDVEKAKEIGENEWTLDTGQAAIATVGGNNG